MDTTEIAAIIGAASALGGVALKIAYDSVRERSRAKHAADDRFLNERKEAYDAFWSAHKEVTQDAELLRELALIIRAGKNVKDGVLESFCILARPSKIMIFRHTRRSEVPDLEFKRVGRVGLEPTTGGL